MLIGTMLLAVGILHVLVGGVLYAGPLLDILRDGVFASVPDFGDRATALWFIVAGIGVVVLGACVRELERARVPLPAALVPGLWVLTIAVVVPMPISGGWLFAPIAVLAHRRARAFALA
jgi:hypothetical protein